MIESQQNINAASMAEVVPAGEYWLRRIEAGNVLRITDLHGKNRPRSASCIGTKHTHQALEISKMLVDALCRIRRQNGVLDVLLGVFGHHMLLIACRRRRNR